jgi:cytoskeletal protein CcmA (bactofilin family)
MASVFGKEESGKRGPDDLILYIGKGVELKGTVNFEGSGRIDGKVEGKVIVKGSVVFGEGAMVTSDVEGDTVVVGGKVTGTITARQKVQLLRSSVFTGDLLASSVLIEDGAQFNGTCKMTGVSTHDEHFNKENGKPILAAVR